jgi:hypothetical protein
MSELVLIAARTTLPAIVAAGERASLRFLEFFAAKIRNPHTRRAYSRAVSEFMAWREDNGVTLITADRAVHDIAPYDESPHVSGKRASRSAAPLSEKRGTISGVVEFPGRHSTAKPGMGLPAAPCVTMPPGMFVVTEADAAEIRSAYEQEGEVSAAIELPE